MCNAYAHGVRLHGVTKQAIKTCKMSHMLMQSAAQSIEEDSTKGHAILVRPKVKLNQKCCVQNLQYPKAKFALTIYRNYIGGLSKGK